MKGFRIVRRWLAIRYCQNCGWRGRLDETAAGTGRCPRCGSMTVNTRELKR